jgi:hypothetical protein
MVALRVMRDALVFDLTVHPQRRHALLAASPAMAADR